MVKAQEAMCVFCKKILDEHLTGEFAVFEPLNPVTQGHLLVIPIEHIDNVGDKLSVATPVLQAAARIASQLDNVNVITSKGRYATQTVGHFHIHIVPRRENDGLKLPWTNQKKKKKITNETN